MTRVGVSVINAAAQGASAPQIVPVEALRPSDSPRGLRQDEEHVRKLAESGRDFEPILVHRPTMRVIDGMHRLSAMALRGHREIAVRFFDGSEADAYVLSVQLNVRHGLPLTRGERRLAASRILLSHPHWSDRAIAERTGLSDKTVGKLRRSASAEIPQSHSRVGRDGAVRPLNSAEGRRRAASLLTAHPDASLRELAERSGVSTATVRDVRDRLYRGQDPVPDGRRGAAGDAVAGAGGPLRHTVCCPGRPDEPRGAAALAALQRLAKDPSLKGTEPGRLLLRMLLTTQLEPSRWQEIAAVLPAHCAPLVRAAAEQRAAEWNALARTLARHAEGAA
ncbi:ParB N-terminal domain-containing protein [Streptomyces sp. NPDC005728]|uniref:ParB/RepB/Spo0J family partition protein n=1 Tax=Streptomyces sp. NPDC005728 TaxID=3157054 RepID=UPI003409CA9A